MRPHEPLTADEPERDVARIALHMRRSARRVEGEDLSSPSVIARRFRSHELSFPVFSQDSVSKYGGVCTA